MSSVNKVMLVGNVGKDPEFRTTSSGERVASFSLATSDRWKDKATGERKERTEWHNIVVFNEQLVGILDRYVRKGSRLYVEGKLQTRKWTDKNGQDRYTTEVVLQPFRGEIQLVDRASDEPMEATVAGMVKAERKPPTLREELQDDVPF